jgi:hypothetical protein
MGKWWPFAAVAGALLTTACWIPSPHRMDISLSPDGAVIADWYMDDTRNYVQLRRRGERFSYGHGTVLEAHGYPLEMNWKSNTELEIVYQGFYSVERRESRWNGVSIAYREDHELTNRVRERHGERFHFNGLDSPSGTMFFASWQQDEKRGDERWWEDCVEVYRQTKGDYTQWASSGCVFVGVSGDDLKMKWIGRKQLAITYPPGTKVSKAETKANDVTITYTEDLSLQKY